MSKNIFTTGNVVTVASPSGGVTSGDYVLFSQYLHGNASATVAVGLDLELETCGVFEFTMNTGTAVSVGDRMLWDASAGTFDNGATPASGTDVYAGVAVRAQGTSDTVCLVKLYDHPDVI